MSVFFLAVLVPIVASVIGGFVAGYFVRDSVKRQFRQQSEAALRALMIEVGGNRDAAADMVRTAGAQTFEAGRADPGWLKHSIWDSQLPYVVQLFDDLTLRDVSKAYALLDAVPAMVIPEGVVRPPGSSRYARAGWIESHLTNIHHAFMDADRDLQDLRRRLASETPWQRFKHFGKD